MSNTMWVFPFSYLIFKTLIVQLFLRLGVIISFFSSLVLFIYINNVCCLIQGYFNIIIMMK